MKVVRKVNDGLFQNETKGKNQEINLSLYKKSVEGLWKRNLGKRLLCMIKLDKIKCIYKNGF